MTYLITLLAIFGLAWAVLIHNRLVRARNQVRTAWADIDVQLNRRHDLVPQLVATVGAYARHEATTLEAVTALRARALAGPGPQQLGQVESDLVTALDRLLALREAYPALKADSGFARLQHDLVEVEAQLQYARRFYNGAVRDLNDAVQRIPDALIARSLGFGPAEFFQAETPARGAPTLATPP